MEISCFVYMIIYYIYAENVTLQPETMTQYNMQADVEYNDPE